MTTEPASVARLLTPRSIALVGASTDVIEASWIALQDAYEYWITRWGVRA